MEEFPLYIERERNRETERETKREERAHRCEHACLEVNEGFPRQVFIITFLFLVMTKVSEAYDSWSMKAAPKVDSFNCSLIKVRHLLDRSGYGGLVLIFPLKCPFLPTKPFKTYSLITIIKWKN